MSSLGIFKDVRFYSILNFGHFWAPPSPLTFHKINNDGQSIFLGRVGGGEITEKKNKREQTTFSQKHGLCPFRCLGCLGV